MWGKVGVVFLNHLGKKTIPLNEPTSTFSAYNEKKINKKETKLYYAFALGTQGHRFTSVKQPHLEAKGHVRGVSIAIWLLLLPGFLFGEK